MDIKFSLITFVLSFLCDGSESENCFLFWSKVSSQFLQRRRLHLMKEAIDGTIHCKPGVAELLVHEVYTILNNWRRGWFRSRG